MFCPFCGAKNEDDAIFCEACGERITEEPAAPAAQTVQSSLIPAAPAQIYSVQTAMPPKAPRKKLSRKAAVLIAAAVVIVGGGILTYFILANKNSPMSVADSYVKNMMDGNAQAMYSQMNLPAGDFDTEEQFAALISHGENDYTAANVLDYKITDTSSGDSNAAVKDLQVQFTLRDGSSDFYDVRLVRQKDKKDLFFSDWKVESSDLVASKYTVYVPKGAALAIDGTAVADSCKAAVSDNDGFDEYNISNIFTGSHEIAVTEKDMEDYTDTVSVVNGGAATVSGLTPSDALIQKICSQQKDMIQQIYNAAIARQNFSTIAKLFTDDSSTQSDLQNDYQSFVYSLPNDDYDTLKSVTIEEVNEYSGSGYAPSLNNDGSLTLYFSCNFTYSAEYLDSWTDATVDFTPGDDCEYSYACSFVKNSSGSWVMDSMPELMDYFPTYNGYYD